MKRKKNTVTETVESDLFLIGCESKQYPGYADIDLAADDEENREGFRLFAYDVLFELFGNEPSVATIFYEESYIERKAGFFNKERETVFSDSGYIAKIIHCITENSVDCMFESYVICDGEGKSKHTRKVLRIYHESTNTDYIMGVFRDNDSLAELPHLSLSFERMVPHTTEEDMRVTDNTMTENTALCATIDEWEERILFLVKFDLYSKERFINCIRDTARKHGKTLFINIKDNAE